MRVVIAMDSFKGSLSSIEAGKAVAEGVRRADGAIECVVCPVADGGEGTSAALTEGLHGETVRVRVTGPLGEKVTAEYGVKGDLAILEMAQASGLPLVPQDKRNPMKTTTYGVGEMLRDAINRGCKPSGSIFWIKTATPSRSAQRGCACSRKSRTKMPCPRSKTALSAQRATSQTRCAAKTGAVPSLVRKRVLRPK